MSIDVKFLGESFSFNDDLKIYIEALNDCEKISDDLFKAFRTKGNKNEGFIEVKDLHKDMLKHAEKFIAKLCEKGIFSKSAEDYTYNNKGYKAIDEACSDSVRARAQYLSEEIQAFKDGMNAAEYDAASKITGSGVSVYSSSFLTLAVASAVEQSIVNSQAQKANSEYSKAISELSDRTDSNLSRKNGQYYRNTYLPRMNEAITVFAYGLMEFFIADLMAEGKFDADVLENTDIKKSNTLLTNLKHISEEESRLNCIKQAFVACPFNTELYKVILKSKKFDKDTFITAAIFGKSDVIINELREKINFNGVSSLSRDIEKSKKYMELYSVCTGVSYAESLHKYTEPFYEMVISDYQRLMKPNNIVAQKFDKMTEDSILSLNAASIKGHISNEVKRIISTDSFEMIRTICGFTDILDKISVIDNTSHNFASKDELDNAYIEYLCKEYTKKIEAKQSELTDARNKKAEEERIRAEEEKARATKNEKIAKIVLIIIAIAIVFIIVFTYIILPNIKKNNAEKSIANGNFDNAIAIYADLGAEDMVLDTKYKKAVSLMESGDFDGSIAIFTELGEYLDCKEKITETMYQKGLYLMTIKEHIEAYKVFTEIENYKNCKDLIIDCSEANKYVDIFCSSKGDTVSFGYYEQDNNFDNGKEPIEWVILKKEENKLLIISKKIIEKQIYTNSRIANWTSSNVKTFLNDGFLLNSFSNEELEFIKPTEISIINYDEYKKFEGKSENKVFLLSKSEYEELVVASPADLFELTDYVRSTSNIDYWALRTNYVEYNDNYILLNKSYLKCINKDGKIYNKDSGYLMVGLRPAMWISAE